MTIILEESYEGKENIKNLQNKDEAEEVKILEVLQEFLDKNNIKVKELFDWLLKRNQQEFYSRLKSSRTQFRIITVILAGIIAGLFAALFTGFILAETFLSILGIVIGYLFYLLKFSAISPFEKATLET